MPSNAPLSHELVDCYTHRREKRVAHAPSPSDDAELVRRLIAREERAFNEAVRAFHGKMLRLARTLVGEAIADEVVQEAWVAVLKALPGFEGRSRLSTWILGIVGNMARTRLRKEARNVRLEPNLESELAPWGEDRFDATGHWRPVPLPWHDETPEALLATEQLRNHLYAAIAALPRLQRAVLTLRDMDGLEMDEICNILQISSTNGRVLLHRARNRLRAAIEEFERERTC